MKGHEPILEMRKQHLQPEWVFINDYPCKTNWQLFDDFVTVCVDGENIRKLDLRFLLGCKVSIASTNERRAKQLFDECKRFAIEVAASVIDPDSHYNKQYGWSATWQR